MPTGYTASVGDGTVTDFAEYATQCMRAFGALIMMRDDPSDASIKVPEVNSYHKTSLIETEDELAVFRTLTDTEISQLCAKEYADGIESWTQRSAEMNQVRQRYESMLAKARAFKPPSDEHSGFAEFLVKQLEESISHDCYDREEYRPKLVAAADWKIAKLASLKHWVDYHKKKYDEEVEITASRRMWIQQAREAIARVPTSAE